MSDSTPYSQSTDYLSLGNVCSGNIFIKQQLFEIEMCEVFPRGIIKKSENVCGRISRVYVHNYDYVRDTSKLLTLGVHAQRGLQ